MNSDGPQEKVPFRFILPVLGSFRILVDFENLLVFGIVLHGIPG